MNPRTRRITPWTLLASALITCLSAAAFAQAPAYTELNTADTVTWNDAGWTAGVPSSATAVGLLRGTGTVVIDAASTATTPAGLLVGWNTSSFSVDVTGGSLTVGSTVGTGNPVTPFGLTLGENGGRTGTLNQSGGTVTAPLVRSNNGTGVYNLNSGTLQTQQVFRQSATSLTLNFGGGTLAATGTSEVGLTGSGVAVVVNAGGGTLDNGGLDVSMKGTISGAGPLSLVGSGTTTFGAANTHSGTLTLSAGTLRVGDGGTIGGAAGSLVNDAAVVFDRSTDLTYSGLISGTGTVTKQNTNTLILSPVNTYSGLTTVAAGTLQSGSNSPNTIVGGSYDVESGAKLVFSRNLNTTKFLTQSISGAGDLEFQGQEAGFYTFMSDYTGTLSYTGQTIVNLTTNPDASWFRNTLWLEKDNVLPNATVVNMQSGKIYLRAQSGTGIDVAGLTGNAGTFVTTDRTVAQGIQKWTVTVASGSSHTYAGVIGADGTGTGTDNILFTKAGAGTQILTGSNTYTGGTIVSGGTLQVGAGGTVGQIVGNITANANLVFDRSDDIALAGSISGSGTVTKRNANTLTLSSNSLPFSGSISLDAGSLRLTADAGSVPIAATISGSGGLVRDAATNASGSFLILNGSNTYSGGTTINAGLLQLGTNDALGSGPLVFTADENRGSLNMQGFNQTIAGLSATNTNQFRGDIYNNVNNATSTLTINVPTGQAFVYANQIGAEPGLLWGKINVVKAGAGTQTFSGTNLYTGSTSITGGRLVITSTGRINQTSGITISGSGAELNYNSATALTAPLTFTQGTISGTGTIGTAVVVGAGAILSPGNSPGAQAYSSGLTWSPEGTYTWEINDATGAAGTNWDVLNVSGGALDLSGLSAGNTFNLDLTTLTGSASGPMANYVDGQAYTFSLATYASLSLPAGFSGTDLTSLFSLSFDNWENAAPSLANVSIVNNPATSTINLVVVPEPGTLALAAMALTAAAAWKLRRRS